MRRPVVIVHYKATNANWSSSTDIMPSSWYAMIVLDYSWASGDSNLCEIGLNWACLEVIHYTITNQAIDCSPNFPLHQISQYNDISRYVWGISETLGEIAARYMANIPCKEYSYQPDGRKVKGPRVGKLKTNIIWWWDRNMKKTLFNRRCHQKCIVTFHVSDKEYRDWWSSQSQ